MNVEALFKQYYPRLRNYAIRYVGSSFAAEDIVQECFIKLYEKRFTIKDVSPGALLFVMVRNSCINFLKLKSLTQENRSHSHLHIKPFAQTGTPLYIATEMTPEDDLMFEELRLEIERVMESLPPKCKEVFWMSRFEGMNTREIADQIGTSTQNVEKHIAKAKEVFTQHFAGLDISTAGVI